MSKSTPHSILQITTTATATDIKAAYRRLILVHHPDKAPEGKRDAATQKFREIQYAYEVLTDPEKAAEYAAEKLRQRKDKERAQNQRWERQQMQRGGEEGESSRQKREEAERNATRNRDIGRIKAREQHKGRETSSKPAREGNERTARNSGRAREHGEGDAPRDGRSGKKKVRFSRGSTPPPRRHRDRSSSFERDAERRPCSPSRRRSRDEFDIPPMSSFNDPRRASRPDEIHIFLVEHDHNARINERRTEARRTPSRHSLRPDDLAPLPNRIPTARRPQSAYDLRNPAPRALRPNAQPTNPNPGNTLTSNALSSATLLIAPLTALADFLTRDLHHSPNSSRPTLVTNTLTTVTLLVTRLHTLQSRADASLAAQARDLATHSALPSSSTAQRDLARAVTEVSKLERMLRSHAETVRAVLYEVLPPSGAMRVGAAAAGGGAAGVDEEVVAVVHRGWAAQRDREREGGDEGAEGAMWTAEKRSRLWCVLEKLGEEAGRLVPVVR